MNKLHVHAYWQERVCLLPTDPFCGRNVNAARSRARACACARTCTFKCMARLSSDLACVGGVATISSQSVSHACSLPPAGQELLKGQPGSHG